jgi:hypothetical protein
MLEHASAKVRKSKEYRTCSGAQLNITYSYYRESRRRFAAETCSGDLAHVMGDQSHARWYPS